MHDIVSAMKFFSGTTQDIHSIENISLFFSLICRKGNIYTVLEFNNVILKTTCFLEILISSNPHKLVTNMRLGKKHHMSIKWLFDNI